MNKVLIYVRVLSMMFCFLMFIFGLAGTINIIANSYDNFGETLGFVALFLIGSCGLIKQFHDLNIRMLGK